MHVIEVRIPTDDEEYMCVAGIERPPPPGFVWCTGYYLAELLADGTQSIGYFDPKGRQPPQVRIDGMVLVSVPIVPMGWNPAMIAGRPIMLVKLHSRNPMFGGFTRGAQYLGDVRPHDIYKEET